MLDQPTNILQLNDYLGRQGGEKGDISYQATAFMEGLDTVCHKILIEKLMNLEWDEQAVKLLEKWPRG